MKSRLPLSHWIFTRPGAHRGLHNDSVPENSLPAFENAIKKDYPIELDLQMTSDKKIVCFHDDNPKRMTGVDCDIRKTPYSTVKQWKLKNTDLTVPDFKEVLDTVDGRVPLIIEIKAQLQDGIEELVVDQLKGYAGEYVVQSFDPRIILKIKKISPETIRGLLGTADKTDKGFFTDFVVKRLPLNGIVKPDFINYRVQDLPLSNFVSNKIPTICWTVRTNEQKQIAQKYALNYVFENVEP